MAGMARTPSWGSTIRSNRLVIGSLNYRLLLCLAVAVVPVAVTASNCPSLTYGAIPLGAEKREVLAMFQEAGCEVRERPKGYPDGLFLIDTESSQVRALSVDRSSATIRCACWARVHHAQLVFGPEPKQALYAVERRIAEEETDPQRILTKYKMMLDPLLGLPGSPKFQDHRLEGFGLDYRYRTHFMDWYDRGRDVRSYLIVKEVKEKGAEEVYVGHIWMPAVE
jgi:hypothetical protein